MYCIAGSPFYQNTKQTLSGIFCRRWRKEFFSWIPEEKNIFFYEEKSFLSSILHKKEGDSFIIVSKDKYGGVALSSYILINSRPASELSLLPHINVTSLRWWSFIFHLFSSSNFCPFTAFFSNLLDSCWRFHVIHPLCAALPFPLIDSDFSFCYSDMH